MFKHLSQSGEVHSRKTVYQGRVFAVQKLTITTPDGLAVERDLIKTGPTVTILAISDQGRVVITSEYRVGVNHNSVSLPAGLVNPAETLEHAAIRELHEETGYEATRTTLMTTITSSEGFMDQTAALMLLHFDERKRQAPHFDTDEFVTAELVPYETVIDWVKTGRINTAQALSALGYYELFLKQKGHQK